tara:strand:- start:36483 stop:37037 length:555 start_codon:yes stop_codon:yes gene_type:complete
MLHDSFHKRIIVQYLEKEDWAANLDKEAREKLRKRKHLGDSELSFTKDIGGTNIHVCEFKVSYLIPNHYTLDAYELDYSTWQEEYEVLDIEMTDEEALTADSIFVIKELYDTMDMTFGWSLDHVNIWQSKAFTSRELAQKEAEKIEFRSHGKWYERKIVHSAEICRVPFSINVPYHCYWEEMAE